MVRRKRRWLYPLLLVVVLLVVAEAAMFVCVVANAGRMDAPQPADALIVLGAGIRADGTPSPMLQRRLDRAVDLYRQGYAGVIIPTGAQGDDEPMPEALSMQAYLIAQGVPGEAIWPEANSFNTRQNLQNAKAIMEAGGLDTAVVVSSDYHLWRALSICEDIGLVATGAGAQNALTRGQAIINCLRETVSWWKYLIVGGSALSRFAGGIAIPPTPALCA